MAAEDEDLFSNDGNFLERFMKMEEEKKKKEEQSNISKKLPPLGPTIPMRRKNMKPHPFGTKKPKDAFGPLLIHQTSLYYE